MGISEGQSKRIIKKRLGQLKKYASYNNAVYRGKYLIALGEFLRLKGDLATSAKLYSKAEAESKKADSMYERAFAIERLGMIAKQKGRDIEADNYFNKAVALYKKWGLQWKHGLFNAKVTSGNKSKAGKIELSLNYIS